ncbi:hypothetical protein E2C01_038151 [Portunus trituberculatus]|uniref:Uncharacterized protein n=1 Tax=Portunus trituberculatus TaxID=210409 RepID=A0A5B7FHR9_PORTR|nr:hypothetical protein [Portunus trituberculatus]
MPVARSVSASQLARGGEGSGGGGAPLLMLAPKAHTLDSVCGAVEPCVLWGPRGLQAYGFKSCPRSECRLGFLTLGNGFLAGGV